MFCGNIGAPPETLSDVQYDALERCVATENDFIAL